MSTDFLYRLLPEIYRQRDIRAGFPLRALLRVLDGERLRVTDDIKQLYENWFPETCETWAIPLVTRVLGATAPDTGESGTQNIRAWLTNTKAFERRKGTIPATERMLTDLTGWPVRLEFRWEAEARTREVSGPAARTFRTLDLRNPGTGERVNPFHPVGRTADFRKPEIEVFVWKNMAFPLSMTTPKEVAPGCFTFHPMGMDTALVNAPASPGDMESRVGPQDVPAPIGRVDLEAEVRAIRRGECSVEHCMGRTAALGVFASFRADKAISRISPREFHIADLSEWPFEPHELRAFRRLGVRVIIDPELGRLVFPARPARAAVSFAYAADLEIGGGPYPRPMERLETGWWTAYVHSHRKASAQGNIFESVGDALKAFARIPGSGVIRILDSATSAIREDLAIGPVQGCVPNATGVRRLVIEAESGETPCLRGTLRLEGAEPGMSITLDGLWVDGDVVAGGNLILNLRHTTIGVLRSASHQEPRLEVNAKGCVLGDIHVAADAAGLRVEDCLVRGDVHGPAAMFLGSTVYGRVRVTAIERSSNSVFRSRVTVERTDVGFFEFSAVTPDSITPARTEEPQESSNIGVERLAREAEREIVLGRALAEYLPEGFGWRVREAGV